MMRVAEARARLTHLQHLPPEGSRRGIGVWGVTSVTPQTEWWS